MEIDAEREIVELLAAGPSSLRPLRGRVPRTTLYEALGRMRARGVVVPGDEPGTWRLVEPPPPSRPTPASSTRPTLPVPHLDVLPSAEHRALGRLILLAATARRHYEHHHASFVLFSSTGLKGKTWLARWAALTLGAAPSALVHAGAESGRSLSARRRSTGEIAAVRAALSGPLLCVDEFLRGQVQAACMVLISGDKNTPLEDESLVVHAVVMLMMNSRPSAITVEEATTLDAAMLRRCFAADLQRVLLDATFARDGEERLDSIRSLGAVTLPEIVAGTNERAVRDRIADTLEVVLDSPERLGSLDLVLLGQLAVAAVAWGLSIEDAVTLVVHDAATVWATTNWTTPEWEAALSEVMLPAAEVSAVAKEAMPLAVDDLEYEYEARLVEVDRAVRHAGVELSDLPGVLRDGAALRSLGLDATNVEGLRVILGLVDGPRLELLGFLDDLRLDAAEAQAALDGHVAAGKLLALDGDQVAALARELARVGEPTALAAWVAAVVQRHGSLRRMLRSAERLVATRRSEAERVGRELTRLAERVRRLDLVLRRARARGDGWALDRADDQLGDEIMERIVASRGRRG